MGKTNEMRAKTNKATLRAMAKKAVNVLRARTRKAVIRACVCSSAIRGTEREAVRNVESIKQEVEDKKETGLVGGSWYC